MSGPAIVLDGRACGLILSDLQGSDLQSLEAALDSIRVRYPQLYKRLVLSLQYSDVTGVQPSISDLGGVSVPALVDITSGVNAPIATAAIDVTQFRQIYIIWSCSGGSSTLNVIPLDDADVQFGLTICTPAAAVAGQVALGPGCSAGGNVTQGIGVPLPRHLQFTMSAAGIGNTVRLRVIGRR